MTTSAPRLVDETVVAVAAPLRKQVIALLRQSIISFQYEPGQRLRENDLSSRFGVSRTVIREALRVLETEGLVQLVPNKGPVVATLTQREAKELFEVRGALESLAAARCAERASAEQKVALRQSLDAVRIAFASGDLANQLAAKDDFYTAMLAGADNLTVNAMLKTIHARAQMLRGVSLRAEGRTSESLVELDALVRAIENSDAALAGKLAEEHVANARDAALTSREIKLSGD